MVPEAALVLSPLVARGLAGHLPKGSATGGTWPKTYGSRCANRSPFGCTAPAVPPTAMSAGGAPAASRRRGERPHGAFLGGRPLGLPKEQTAHRRHGHQAERGARRARERGPVDDEHDGYEQTAERGPAHHVSGGIGRGAGGGRPEWFGVQGPVGTYGFGRGRRPAAAAGRRGGSGGVGDRGRGHGRCFLIGVGVIAYLTRKRPLRSLEDHRHGGRDRPGVPRGDGCRAHRALPSGAGSCMLRGTPSRFGGSGQERSVAVPLGVWGWEDDSRTRLRRRLVVAAHQSPLSLD